ncbi:IS3 family transposase [Streptomyces sp. NPDC002784]
MAEPRRHWKTLSEVELATAERIDWYCHRRLHGEIGHIPPAEYETNYYRETTTPQARSRRRLARRPQHVVALHPLLQRPARHGRR